MTLRKTSTTIELTILIPVYNEEKTILEILQKTTSLPIKKYEVIVVDDASKDKSASIIEKFSKKFRSKSVDLKFLKHKKNAGKGAGIQTALKNARGKYFVIQDADLEYDPSDIPRILSTAEGSNYDAVYGSRFMGNINGMPRANYYANHGYNIILRILYNTKVTDMHTCYKMVRTALLKDVGVSSNGFDYATEIISKLLRRGIKIHEVPISFNGRTKKEGKKIDVMDGIECAYKLLRFRVGEVNKISDPKSATFGRFLIVGVIGFFTNYLSLVAITELFGLDHIVSEAFAAFIALQITFILHDRWTYTLDSKNTTRRLGIWTRYSGYLVSNAFGSLMTVVGFSLIFNYLTRLPSLLIAAVGGLVWNYLMNTYVIWSKSKDTKAR